MRPASWPSVLPNVIQVTVGTVLTARFALDHLRVVRSLLDPQEFLAGIGLDLLCHGGVDAPPAGLCVLDCGPEFGLVRVVDHNDRVR
jgi:hypothetical protein